MRVLVTGHDGYIGSVTVPILRDAGHDVVGLDTFFYEGCDFDGGPPTGVDSVRLDVRDVTPEHLRGFDAVVHLAALSNDPLGALAPQLTTEINFAGTVAVARAAREAGVSRFVFASSCSMYGATGTGDAVDETAPLQPLTAYAESKVRSEEALSTLADDGFSPIYMRNATAYGVSPRLRLDVVVNNLTAWAHTTSAVKIMSDGTPWRPLVHVRDIARATVVLLDAPRDAVHDQAFNIGGDTENYQVREIADIVAETVPGCRVEYAGSGDHDPRSYRVDFGKFARAFPDFALEWNVPAGVRELYDAYLRTGLTYDDFQGDSFIRLQCLKRRLDGAELDASLRWSVAA